MGVKDLFKLTIMSPFSEKIKDLLDSKVHTIGIDMYVLFHRFAIDVNVAATLVTNPEIYLPEYYLRIKNYLMSLITLGFELYLVYDGNKMKYKITEQERERRRELAKMNSNYIEAVEIVPQQMYNFQHYISDMNIPYIVAPFEADAQLTYLYKEHLIDCVLTNDSDLIIYGVEKIIFIRPKGEEYYEYMPNDSQIYLNNIEKKWYPVIAYLIGCDYFKGIKGVGYKRAFDILKEWLAVLKKKDIPEENELMFKELYAILKSKKFVKNLEEEKYLCERYQMVKKIYNRQYVIDPRDSKLKDLCNTIVSDEFKNEFGVVREFESIEKIMKGNVNPINNQEFQLVE